MDLWSEILSREPSRIQLAFQGLRRDEKINVRAHLIKMTTEADWHPEQVLSAKIALKALKDLPDR